MFKSFSHKEIYVNQVVALHDKFFHQLQFDRFDDNELDAFRKEARGLGESINVAAGLPGMLACRNYLGTSADENFGHDTINGESAKHMQLLLDHMWDGIGEWQT